MAPNYAQEQMEAHAPTQQELESIFREMPAHMNDLKARNIRLEEENASLRNQAQRHFSTIQLGEHTIATLNDEIKELKAQLYDYIMACGLLEES